MNFGKIFTHGSLVDINIRMWTAQKKLNAEDLGIECTKVSQAFTLGRKMLIPYEVIAEFKSLDGHARHLLAEHSFACDFGNARFVPKKRLVEFSNKMDAVIAKFNYKADELARNYPTYRLEMREEYIKAAGEAYDRNAALNQGMTINRNTFINEFIERIEKAYPDASEIRSKFSMEYIVFQVELPDLSQANYADLIEDSEKLRLLEETYKRNLNKKVDSFFNDITTELRDKATATLQRFLNVINSGNKVRELSVKAVKEMIEEYEKMNFVGDDIFLKHLQMFRTKCLDAYTTNTLTTDKVVRETIKRELKTVIEIATNKAAITELVCKYKQEIGI